MAEEVVARIDDQEELRVLLRELSNELALADMIRFKRQKLLDGLDSFKEEKTKSLADEYHNAIEEINEGAASNMAEEIAMMDAFTAEVQSFNDLCADCVAALATLKAELGEGE